MLFFASSLHLNPYWILIQQLPVQDIEDGSYSSDAYTESDIDKEYSTDNDIPEDDGSYGSGEDVEEDLNDDTEHSSGMRVECDSNIRIDNADDKVLHLITGFFSNIIERRISLFL